MTITLYHAIPKNNNSNKKRNEKKKNNNETKRNEMKTRSDFEILHPAVLNLRLFSITKQFLFALSALLHQEWPSANRSSLIVVQWSSAVLQSSTVTVLMRNSLPAIFKSNRIAFGSVTTIMSCLVSVRFVSFLFSLTPLLFSILLLLLLKF